LKGLDELGLDSIHRHDVESVEQQVYSSGLRLWGWNSSDRHNAVPFGPDVNQGPRTRPSSLSPDQLYLNPIHLWGRWGFLSFAPLYPT
jgi:hypothetical protein